MILHPPYLCNIEQQHDVIHCLLHFLPTSFRSALALVRPAHCSVYYNCDSLLLKDALLSFARGCNSGMLLLLILYNSETEICKEDVEHHNNCSRIRTRRLTMTIAMTPDTQCNHDAMYTDRIRTIPYVEALFENNIKAIFQTECLTRHLQYGAHDSVFGEEQPADWRLFLKMWGDLFFGMVQALKDCKILGTARIFLSRCMVQGA